MTGAYRIEKLAERVRARVNELKNLASVAYSDITDEVDSILAAYAGTDLEVPSAQSEAYAKQAALRKKLKWSSEPSSRKRCRMMSATDGATRIDLSLCGPSEGLDCGHAACPRIVHSSLLGADAFADSVAPAIHAAQAAGAKTLREIAAAFNGRGVATARGDKWEAKTVSNELKRLG